ncbi:hypothetical protein STTU_1500 [Streptomyces sp. Tu6071]|nr:hypothetical protein STTU_1500 [Streptomyces sp. Tu6071]
MSSPAGRTCGSAAGTVRRPVRDALLRTYRSGARVRTRPARGAGANHPVRLCADPRGRSPEAGTSPLVGAVA